MLYDDIKVTKYAYQPPPNLFVKLHTKCGGWNNGMLMDNYTIKMHIIKIMEERNIYGIVARTEFLKERGLREFNEVCFGF